MGLTQLSVVKTLPFNAGSTGSIPAQETKVPHAAQCDQKFFLDKE